jgi:formylglycine-generating enzyme
MKKQSKTKVDQVAPRPRANLRLWLGAAVVLALVVAGAIYLRRSDASSASHNASSNHHGQHAANDKQPDAASVAAIGINKTPPPGPAPEGMVWIPGGTFWMGCEDCEMPDAAPAHLVTVDGFWMDKTPVTNAEFAKFVQATGYQTIAERKPDPKDYPGAPPENLVAGCAVFSPPPGQVSLDNPYAWWRYVPGASWKSPEGPGSSVKARADHPAVHIAWDDAVAYAKWAGKQLPTEAQFEFAARGGLDRKAYAWGNDLQPGGKWVANIWQGQFPSENTRADGYESTAPVTAFAPNGYGLYDVGGNVWQWCADWYRPDYFKELAKQGTARNPQGPPDSHDPQEPGIPKRVQKSGSFLCSDQYCSRYLVGSRGKGATDSGSSNVGFRCIKPVA